MEIGRDGHAFSSLRGHLVKQPQILGARAKRRIVPAHEHPQARIANAHKSIVRESFSQNVRRFEVGGIDIRQATFLEDSA